jgi:predicted glycosyltransferase
VCVPRVSPRTEQLVRAEAFAARGLLRLVRPDELHPGRLRREVEIALATDRRSLAQRIAAVIDLDGSRRAAQNLLALAGSASVARRRPMEVRP